jgi:N-acetylmuramoyl-L-alanine amidase
VNTSPRRALAASSVPVVALAALLASQPPANAATAPTSAGTTSAGTTFTGTTFAGTTAAAAPTTSTVSAALGVLKIGSTGQAVLAAQKRLAALGYWLGSVDGIYGPATAHAVTALQKVAGLERDGVLGPKTAKALAAGVRPRARTTSGAVVEIDLYHQVLLVVHNGVVRLVLDTSTGSGAYYTSQGRLHHAVTPKGTYYVFRAVNGWDPGPLGKLYRPRYFNGGIAVHGYPSVPSQPASHGCVRVTLGAMNYLWAHRLLPIGGKVVVR